MFFFLSLKKRRKIRRAVEMMMLSGTNLLASDVVAHSSYYLNLLCNCLKLVIPVLLKFKYQIHGWMLNLHQSCNRYGEHGVMMRKTDSSVISVVSLESNSGEGDLFVCLLRMTQSCGMTSTRPYRLKFLGLIF